MKRTTIGALICCVCLLAGCGDSIRGIDQDAKAAKAQARDAVRSAEDSARRVQELSTIPADNADPTDQPPDAR